MISRVTKKLAKKWVYTGNYLKYNDRDNLKKNQKKKNNPPVILKNH